MGYFYRKSNYLMSRVKQCDHAKTLAKVQYTVRS